MNHQKRVMLLIDADNVSGDVIDQAVGHVKAQHGAIHVRRAYCTAESALANLQLFKRHSIRPIVNLSTGKNSTDISLAVDAIDLVLAERPDIVVVVSSDSDFAPLVIRLREKGCRVEGIGQHGKTGEDSKPVYDDFIDLTHQGGRARATARPAARKRAPVKAADLDLDLDLALEPAPAPASPAVSPPVSPPVSPLVPDRTPTRAAARTARPAEPPARRRAATASVPAQGGRSRARAAPQDAPSDDEHEPARPASRHAPLPDEVTRILAAVPDLWRGGKIELGVASEQLRAGNLLSRSATSSRLFKKFPTHFALTPERQPNKVQYVGPRVV
jgi:uncharacterized protein (TIGR00288 family)